MELTPQEEIQKRIVCLQSYLKKEKVESCLILQNVDLFYPVRNNAPLLHPGQRPSGPAAAAGLDFKIIPAGFIPFRDKSLTGFNVPLGFESQRLEFLTGFTSREPSSGLTFSFPIRKNPFPWFKKILIEPGGNLH